MKKGRVTPPRSDNGRFISDTQHMLEKLNDAKRQVAQKHLANANALSAAERQLTTVLDTIVTKLLPDLSARTEALLKRDVPLFYTPSNKQKVADARNVRVPFWTRFWGGSAAFKKEALDGVHAALKKEFRHWLTIQGSASLFARYGASDLSQRISELRNEKTALDKQHRDLSDRIEKLEAVLRRYAGPKAPNPPKELSEAVRRSSDRVRANPSIVTTTVEREDTFWRDMWLIDQLSERHQRDYYRDDDYRGRGGSFGGGGASSDYTPAPTPTSSPWGEPRETGGRSSSRMGDGVPIPEGRSSARMSDAAPSEEGRSSARLSDAPIIADPFSSSSGHASSSMRSESHDETPTPSSRGTSY